jgi:PAS domain S-box-containing protein
MYRLLVASVVDYAIFFLDPQGNIASWNEGAQRIKGYSADEIIGRHFSTFYPEEDLAWNKPAFELEVAAREGRFEDEGWRLRKDGTRFWANVVITTLRNRAGKIVGYAKVTRDLTERRRATQQAIDDARRIAAEEAARVTAEARAQELVRLATELKHQTREAQEANQELEYQIEEAQAMSEELEQTNAQLHDAMHDAEEARAVAEHANRAKTDFLAAMSHELRTPLNAIGGYTDLLLMNVRGALSEEQRTDIERIRRNQQHLLGIINDILNFSRIEAGQLTYDLVPVPIREVMEGISVFITPQAQARGLEYEQSECAPDVIGYADRTKVEQILLNLVSNAVKFTPPGGRVTLSCRADQDNVILCVRDTGIGIEEDKLATIFEPFIQVGRSLTHISEGTGLGLAISRDLARRMSGDITVESEVGKGATFTVRLPRYRED